VNQGQGQGQVQPTYQTQQGGSISYSPYPYPYSYSYPYYLDRVSQYTYDRSSYGYGYGYGNGYPTLDAGVDTSGWTYEYLCYRLPYLCQPLIPYAYAQQQPVPQRHISTTVVQRQVQPVQPIRKYFSMKLLIDSYSPCSHHDTWYSDGYI